MASAGLQETIELARICGFSRRMPSHALRLAESVKRLDESAAGQLRSLMLEEGIAHRMARRACQVAPSSTIGADRIIEVLVLIVGRPKAVTILRFEGYDERIVSCIRKFTTPKKRRFAAAQELCEHLRRIFGDREDLLSLTRQVQQSAEPAACAA